MYFLSIYFCYKQDMRSFTLLLLFSLLSTNVRATQKCGTSNYFIPIDEKKSHLEASQTCVEYGGAWANVDFENYDEIRQVMDTCFPKGIQVWIR